MCSYFTSPRFVLRKNINMQATQPQRVIISLSLQYNLIEFTSQKQCYCSANSCLLLTSFNHLLLKEQPISHQKPHYFTSKFCTFLRLSPLLFHLNTSFYKTKAVLLPPFCSLLSHKTNPRVKQNQQKTSFYSPVLVIQEQYSSVNKP